jgi:hypothetical protein
MYNTGERFDLFNPSYGDTYQLQRLEWGKAEGRTRWAWQRSIESAATQADVFLLKDSEVMNNSKKQWRKL